MTKRKSLNFTNLDAFQPRSDDTHKTRADPIIDIEGWPSREALKPKSRAVEQIALRVPKEDLDLFNQLASEGNFSKPQLLRRLMRAYQAYERKEELGQ